MVQISSSMTPISWGEAQTAKSYSSNDAYFQFYFIYLNYNNSRLNLLYIVR